MGRREQREQIFKLLFLVEFHDREDMPEQLILFFEEDDLEVMEAERLYIT